LRDIDTERATPRSSDGRPRPVCGVPGRSSQDNSDSILILLRSELLVDGKSILSGTGVFKAQRARSWRPFARKVLR
jgi:hypothetical protein